MNMHFNTSAGIRPAVYYLKKLFKLESFRRHSCSFSEAKTRANALFSQEKQKQYEEVGRIDKIKIDVFDFFKSTSLMMNAGISTPYNCAQHFSKCVMDNAPLALLNESTPYDMHRPLTESCSLKFLRFTDDNPYFVNKAFWRTCSVILGAVLTSSFRTDITVTPHSFPAPKVQSGSFVYDVSMTFENWQPKKEELRILSAQMVAFAQKSIPIERLTVDQSLALKIFESNPFKTEQIPNIAFSSRDNKVTLYRVGDYIDISHGPLIANTNFINRCSITSLHPLETDFGKLYRFQGVALPKGIMLNHYAYGIIEKHSENLNNGPIPSREQVRRRI